MTDRSAYICYRRGFSDCIALALFHALRARGCDVFVDVGAVEQRDGLHFAQIEARTHFLVVLAPGVIEPLQQSSDPMRLEIDHAAGSRRGIIPLLASGFSFTSTFVPGEISFLRGYYALSLTPESLEETVDALNERMAQTRIFGSVVPAPEHQRQAVAHMIAEAERHLPPTTEELRAEVLFNQVRMRSRGDAGGRLADYDEVLRLNPKYLAARFDRAHARRRTGDDAGAVADYDEVLRQNPQFYQAYHHRAELHFSRGAYERALADYEQATIMHPAYTISLAGKAITLHALGRVDEALRLWLPLVAQDDRFSDPMWVGKELLLPSRMIDEANRLILSIGSHPYAPDD